MAGHALHARCLGWALAVLLPAAAHAYPEYQVYIQGTAGRTVNCAMCHSHPDGPEGTKPGQIGQLAAADLERLNKARAAVEPGQGLDNPILNEFGDSLLNQLGKVSLLALRREPQNLAPSLDQAQDLDGDGIPDAREVAEGTDPLDPGHGDPWSLFVNNFVRNIFHIIMIIVATALGLYGLNHLVHGLHHAVRTGDASGEDGDDREKGNASLH